ncbi:hypothetical protein ABTC66_20410, partial [Acinetobacter baumannii]
FGLASWLFGMTLALFGFLSSIKATTERLTYAWLRRKKARKARRLAAEQQAALAAVPAAG